MSDCTVTYIRNDDNLAVGLEDYKGDLFIHHDIFKWGKNTLLSLDAAIEESLMYAKHKGYGELWGYFKPEQDHLYKFCKRYGFDVVSVSEHEVLVVKDV